MSLNEDVKITKGIKLVAKNIFANKSHSLALNRGEHNEEKRIDSFFSF